jgi:beta-mannosidase
MLRTDLRKGWSVRAIGGDRSGWVPGSYPAEVPGCVHTDLMAAGVILDPYLDGNEAELRWMHEIDWRYATVLDPDVAPLEPVGSGERVDLVFEGIDTIGTVRLGAEKVELGRTYNMHRSYRFDISSQVTGEPIELEVDLDSATTYAEAERVRLGDRPSAYPSAPFNFIRKMACSFGWDWGPDLRTAGLWKPARLERWSIARLAQVRPIVTLDPSSGTGRVELRIELERLDLEVPLTLAAEVLGQRTESAVDAGETSAALVVNVPDAPVWWPVGYGPVRPEPVEGRASTSSAHIQPLADVTLTLAADDQELDRWQRKIGFRTVELDTSPDGIGTGFTILINGQPVFVKGANWIPDDHFLTRITAERIGHRLDQAIAANINLLRVWGGGIYESEDFYRACDERGLLVWQDFLLACAAYPEEAPLWEEIEAEARDNVVRLTPHPSLVLFNGGNENLWGHEDWGWKERLDGRTWGARYADELLPKIVAELDPTRPYSENSPYSPDADPEHLHPNDPDHGTHHQWEVWNRIDYTAYRSEIPRFCSEFGFQALPAWRTLIDWVHAVNGGPLEAAHDPKNDPNFLLHQKAADGNGKLDRGLAPHIGIPNSFANWHWATQLNQARAVAYAIDHYRRWWPRTAGAIVWQLNDCWPVTSWAAIDSEGRPKPLWYALRRAFAPRHLVFANENGIVSAVLLNDTDETWHGALALSRERLDGVRLASLTVEVSVEPRTVTPIALPGELSKPDDPTAEIVVARLDDLTKVHTFVEDIELALEPNPIDVEVIVADDGYAVSVAAHSLARDVTLLVDQAAADATVDDALITLAAGQSWTFRVQTAARNLEQALTRPPVLRTANDLQHP